MNDDVPKKIDGSTAKSIALLAAGDYIDPLEQAMVKEHTEASVLNQPDIPLHAILSFLKDTRGVVNWSAQDLKACLKLDAKQSQQVLVILEMQGYVAKEGNDFLTTAAGETIKKTPTQLPHLQVVDSVGAVLSRRPQDSPDRSPPLCWQGVYPVAGIWQKEIGRSRLLCADLGTQHRLETH